MTDWQGKWKAALEKHEAKRKEHPDHSLRPPRVVSVPTQPKLISGESHEQ